MSESPEHVYLWCDLETTGLDPDRCEITEIATILTKGPDTGFEEIEAQESLIDLPGDTMWQEGAYEMAHDSGLLEELNNDGRGRSLSAVERDLCQTLARFDRVYLAARNVGFERGFLEAHMPDLAHILHYRAFDVTPLFMIAPNLYDYDPDVEGTPHRAAFDIRRDLEYAREFVRRYNDGR